MTNPLAEYIGMAIEANEAPRVPQPKTSPEPEKPADPVPPAKYLTREPTESDDAWMSRVSQWQDECHKYYGGRNE